MFEFFKKFFKKKEAKKEVTPGYLISQYLKSDLSISFIYPESALFRETFSQFISFLCRTVDGKQKDLTINPSKRRSLLVYGYQKNVFIKPPKQIDLITTQELNKIIPPQKNINKSFAPYTKLMNSKKYFFIVHFPGSRVFLVKKNGEDRFYQYEREELCLIQMIEASLKLKKTKTLMFVDVLPKTKRFIKASVRPGMDAGKLIDVTETLKKLNLTKEKGGLL